MTIWESRTVTKVFDWPEGIDVVGPEEYCSLRTSANGFASRRESEAIVRALPRLREQFAGEREVLYRLREGGFFIRGGDASGGNSRGNQRKGHRQFGLRTFLLRNETSLLRTDNRYRHRRNAS